MLTEPQGKNVFKVDEPEKAHCCLSLTSGGKWSFLQNVVLCLCACVFLCVTVRVLLVYMQQTEECINRLTRSLDNQQQQCLCFKQHPPTVYLLSPETSSPLHHFSESCLGFEQCLPSRALVGIRWRLASGHNFGGESGCMMFSGCL